MLQDIFIGREREQQCYRDLLATDCPWVLIITGMGQSGKSRLLRYLKQQTPPDVPVANLDFAMYSPPADHLSVLRDISRQIKPVCVAGATAEFKKALDDGRNSIMDLSAQAKANISQSITVNGGSASGNEIQLKLDQNILEIRKQALEIVLESFYTQLATLNSDRLVIVLDTCEWINQLEVGPWVLDELIPEIHVRLQDQNKQFSVMMAGRVPPQLNAIAKQDQQTLRLPLFSKSEVGQYLQYIGVQDSAMLDYVYDLTCGHAGSMLILYKLCEQQDKMPASVEELRVLEDQYFENVRTDIIEDDILDARFIESPYRELTRYGVLLRRFNQDFLQTVFHEWLPDQRMRELFDQFTRLPHLMPPKDNYYSFFDLLREILASRIFGQEKGMWSKYHGLALTYMTKEAPQSAEWLYYNLAYKLINKDSMFIDREALAQIKAALRDAQTRSQPTHADLALLEVASDKTLKRILLEAEEAVDELVSETT